MPQCGAAPIARGMGVDCLHSVPLWPFQKAKYPHRFLLRAIFVPETMRPKRMPLLIIDSARISPSTFGPPSASMGLWGRPTQSAGVESGVGASGRVGCSFTRM